MNYFKPEIFLSFFLALASLIVCVVALQEFKNGGYFISVLLCVIALSFGLCSALVLFDSTKEVND